MLIRTRFLLLLLLLLASLPVLAGCGDDGGGDPTGDTADMTGGDTAGDTSADTEPDAEPDTAPDADPDAEPDADPDADVDPDVEPDGSDTTAPVISGLVITENPNSVLSAILELATDEPATISVMLTGDDGESWTIEAPEGTSHTIPVVGLHAETAYTFAIEASDAAGNVATDDTLDFTTAALPDDFPLLSATGTASGDVLFNVFRWNPGSDSAWSMLVIVDEQGEPIWYHRSAHRFGAADAMMAPNGNIIAIEGHERIVELDPLGNEVAEWLPEEVGTDAFHHELFVMPDGNWTVLGVALHQDVAGYTDGDGNPVTYDIASDVIVEFDPATKTVVHSYDVFDLIDPLRYLEPSFHGGYWNPTYAAESDATKDWTHGNAVIHDPSDDSYIVSLRHQDWLVKIDRATGELVWKLGPEGDFALTAGGEWQHHQHAPMLTAEGTLLVYDNGNFRPATDPLYSRAVEYQLDETAMTATQLWQYRHSPDLYAPFLGDADLLDNGNILVVSGGAVEDPALPQGDPSNLKWASIVEVTHADPAEEVFSLAVRDETTPIGYSVYRADVVNLR